MRWKTFFSLLFLCLLTFNVDGQSTGWILTVLQKSLIGNIRML